MIVQAHINAQKEMDERRHRAAEEDRQLQRKKLELEERALALREKEVTAAAEERQALLQFLMRQMEKKDWNSKQNGLYFFSIFFFLHLPYQELDRHLHFTTRSWLKYIYVEFV